MKNYILAGVHGRVMRNLLHWYDEAAIAHWTHDSAEDPTWQEAHQQMLKIGHLSKVNHPSKAHSEFQIPEPQVAPGAEKRF